MSVMRSLQFTKMVGAGNDFIVLDARRRGVTPRAGWPAFARRLCDRHRGVGADGVLVLQPSRRADARMRIFNADGSRADMCGNGARCVARYVRRSGDVVLETGAGLVRARVFRDRVRMAMPQPRDLRPDLELEAGGRRYRAVHLNTGVPHLVVPVEDLDAVAVNDVGRLLRFHPSLAPQGANVNFVQPDQDSADRIHVRTYERGVEAETLACGTGVTASAIIHGLTSRGSAGARRVQAVPLSGDRITISFRLGSGDGASRITEVVMEGPARIVFEGHVPLNGGAR